eukprot:Gb_29225 [translate_table: standard]
MPKGTSSRGLSSRRSRAPPYPSNSSREELPQVNSSEAENALLKKDWEDAICPICMHSPHNAVLLLCSSYDKGCRPYMCDTSYRHSNCLDQFRKAYSASAMTTLSGSSDHSLEVSAYPSPEPLALTRSAGGNLEREHLVSELDTSPYSRSVVSNSEDVSLDEGLEPDAEVGLNRTCIKQEVPGLVCPLCRGKVKGWTTVDSARKYLNAKARSCAQESCSSVGTYEELRKHARLVHPLARPSEIDPDQQRNWRRLEQQRDLGDVLSNIRSAMPGAMVLGDYVIEGDNIENEGDDMDFPGDEGNWLTVFLLFQVFEPAANFSSSRNSNLRWRGLARGLRRLGTDPTVRQNLWGENFEGDVGAEGNMTVSSDAGENTGVSTSRRRRSRRRSQSDLI